MFNREIISNTAVCCKEMISTANARVVIWEGRIERIRDAFKERTLLGTFHKVRITLHGGVTRCYDGRAKRYPSDFASLRDYNWPDSASTTTLLISEELHCAGGRCTTVGTAKYPACEVLLRIYHYTSGSKIVLVGSHGWPDDFTPDSQV
jgi:hypothetical protein